MEEKEKPKEIVKIMEYPNGKNIVHIPIRTPEEEEMHRKELYKAAERFMMAVERSCQIGSGQDKV